MKGMYVLHGISLITIILGLLLHSPISIFPLLFCEGTCVKPWLLFLQMERKSMDLWLVRATEVGEFILRI